MKKIIGLILASVSLFVGCDDSSTSAKEENSSSSISALSSETQQPLSSSSSLSSSIGLFSSSSVTLNCKDVGQCELMDATDVTTWNFVINTFSGDVQYSYKVDGEDLIVTTTDANGTSKDKTLTYYNMTTASGMALAFRAAQSTCTDNDGNATTKNICSSL